MNIIAARIKPHGSRRLFASGSTYIPTWPSGRGGRPWTGRQIWCASACHSLPLRQRHQTYLGGVTLCRIADCRADGRQDGGGRRRLWTLRARGGRCTKTRGWRGGAAGAACAGSVAANQSTLAVTYQRVDVLAFFAPPEPDEGGYRTVT